MLDCDCACAFGLCRRYASAFMAGSFTLDVVTPALGFAASHHLIFSHHRLISSHHALLRRPQWVGYVMAIRNLSGLVSGLALGWLSDHVGRFPCYLISLSCEGVMAWAMATGWWRWPGQQHAVLLALAAVMGVGNMGSYTVLRAMLAEQFDGQHTVVAIAALGFINSIAWCLGFVMGPNFSLEQKATVLVGWWITAQVASLIAWRATRIGQDRK